MDSRLLGLVLVFAPLSLFSFGGGQAIIADMQHQVVDVQHWMTDRQFSELFAIAQAAPGPNVVIVTLIGQQAGGVLGGLIATVAMCAPSCVLAFVVSRLFDRFKEAHWRIAIQAGLIPVTIGLVAASALIVARASDLGWSTFAITIATAALVYGTRITPLVPLALAAALGFAGFV